MSPNEVLEKLQKLKVVMSRQTLARYERQSLIPVSRRGGAGRGGGRWTDYPDETVAEAYASCTLIHGNYAGEESASMFVGSPPRMSPNIICLARAICLKRRGFTTITSEGVVTNQNNPISIEFALLARGMTEQKDLEEFYGESLGGLLGNIPQKEMLLLMWVSIIWGDELDKAKVLLKTL